MLLWGLLLMTGLLPAQTGLQFGVLPALNLNKKINPQYKLNFKLEARQVIIENGENSPNYELTDFALILARQTGLDHTLAAGYLIRFRNQQLIHRSIQQWTFPSQLANLGLVHRFVFDQTFSASEATQFRLRYRAAIQLPLNGLALNERELYLKLSNEYLSEWQAEEFDLEIRGVLSLGYRITDTNKVEMGLDNRYDAFLQGQGRLRSWTVLSWYLAF